MTKPTGHTLLVHQLCRLVATSSCHSKPTACLMVLGLAPAMTSFSFTGHHKHKLIHTQATTQTHSVHNATIGLIFRGCQKCRAPADVRGRRRAGRMVTGDWNQSRDRLACEASRHTGLSVQVLIRATQVRKLHSRPSIARLPEVAGRTEETA